MIVILVIVIIKLLIPFIARAIEYKTLAGFEWDGILYTCIEMPILTIFLFQNYYFVYMGLIDFKRRLHMVKAVGSLITPFKDKYDVKY